MKKSSSFALMIVIMAIPKIMLSVEARKLPLVSESSYIIFKMNDLVYAQNGLTGKIDFQGKDPGPVIQSAIDKADKVQGGGTVFIKAGEYKLNSAIILRAKIILRGEGQATVLRQEKLDECGIVYIGSYRQKDVAELEKQGKLKEDDTFFYRKYGVSGFHHVGLRVSDLTLIGPGPNGKGDGIRFEFANSYNGPCTIEGVAISNFGSWQIYSYQNWGGGFVIRDSRIGGDWVGNGIYVNEGHAGRIEKVEVFNLKKGGIGIWIVGGLAFSLSGVVSENNQERLGNSFIVEGTATTTFQSCYSEQADYGIVVRNTKGPITITGCHLADIHPVTIENSENVSVRNNSLDTTLFSYNIVASGKSRNIQVEQNNYWHGKEYKKAD